jgi:GxxExxY protein
MPQVGPAMICASSTTLIPLRGPLDISDFSLQGDEAQHGGHGEGTEDTEDTEVHGDGQPDSRWRVIEQGGRPRMTLLSKELTEKILHGAFRVHKSLGPGLLEGTYRACLLHQFARDGLVSRSEVPIPITYDGLSLETSYRADIIVEDAVILELKAVDRLLPIHEAQLLTYLKLANLRVGLLLNFNVPRLQSGIRRFVR